ncbi:nuclear factor of activated T-cells, cytoplasmic 2 isoform X3 [Gadus morhua]|uniref:nuclear factor of activated T-cells, cytoplasmic 2 isoform X3 n=1 Tax=Gadus morhua TaxID=8049 RepID=UPI0011B63B5C|nr:nuclear factor of activated T-cells, cytoplasmic 2 isoform X3 [Gadus morhua]
MTYFYDETEAAEDLSKMNYPDEDLQFEYLFEYEPPSDDFAGGKQDDPNLTAQKLLSPESEQAFPLEEAPYGIKPCSPSYGGHAVQVVAGYDAQELSRSYLDHHQHHHQRPSGLALSPRIEITPSREHYNHVRDSLQNHPLNTSPRPTLTVPGHESQSYREPQCLSPASSNSSTSWHSESYSPFASPCVSPGSGQTAADLCPRLQSIHTGGSPRTSPGTSPRTSLAEDGGPGGPRSPSPRPDSRSVSPQGKRTYDMCRNQGLIPGHRSRSPSPSHAAHEEYNIGAHYGPNAHLHQHHLHHHHGSPIANVVNCFGPGQPGLVPSKIVRTANHNQVYTLYPENHVEGNYLVSCDQDMKSRPGSEPFFVMPPIWPKPLVSSLCSIPLASLPPLEWPMPNHTEHYELHIDVQPKPHHRAHYETEGSRGAVKAPTGGHPVVQLHGYKGKEPLGLQIFIGTADERILKPHAFYQVHRITGKTVTTTSLEKVVNGTKVLEIPLEPKNNMKAIIDCAGILKLRNADIELRKGETDIGRKNTRVRLVFRVHIPQPGGQHISLQAASHPIECSQRSAHELPLVEKQDMDGCSVLGGQQMILTGQNFSSDSRVIFMEKTQDGQQIWEMEATVDKDKSQPNLLFVEVPSYRELSVCHSVKVHFYVINGKRKRSQPQHFTFTPLSVPSIKTEPQDEYEAAHMGFAVPQMLGLSPHSYYHNARAILQPDSGLVSGLASCLEGGRAPQDPRYQQQQQLQSHAIINAAGLSSPGLYQQMPEPHRSVLVHAGSPSQPLGGPHLAAGQHPSIIQFSPNGPPAHHHLLLRGAGDPPPTAAPPAAPQADNSSSQQPITYGEDGYSPQSTPNTSPHTQGGPAAGQPQHYATVIQPQPQYTQKALPQKVRSPPTPGAPGPEQAGQEGPQEGAPALGNGHQRRVAVKEENLDQAYLDDGECPPNYTLLRPNGPF